MDIFLIAEMLFLTVLLRKFLPHNLNVKYYSSLTLSFRKSHLLAGIFYEQ